jgi:large subunit ribosomal protein L3
LKEYKILESSNYEVGQQFGVEMFEVGQAVAVTGFTIRQDDGNDETQQSWFNDSWFKITQVTRIYWSRYITRTCFPREKMSGRHSMKKRTISGLEIIDIDTKENLLVIKGSIPGKSGNLVSIRTKS